MDARLVLPIVLAAVSVGCNESPEPATMDAAADGRGAVAAPEPAVPEAPAGAAADAEPEAAPPVEPEPPAAKFAAVIPVPGANDLATEAAFNKAMHIDVEAEDVPAATILEALLEGITVNYRARGNIEELLQQPVTINLEDVTHLEAVEAVCREAGVWPEYDEARDQAYTGSVTFHEGVRETQVRFAGPFLVELQKAAPSFVQVRVYGFGIPRARVAKDAASLVQVTEVTGPDGANLLDPTGKASARGNPFTFVHEVLFVRYVAPLAAGVDAGTPVTMRGSVQARILTKVETITFHSIEDGATKSLGGLDFELHWDEDRDEYGEDALSILPKGDLAQFDIHHFDVAAFDAEGKPVDPYSRSKVKNSEGVIEIALVGVIEPVRAELSVVTASDEARYPFEFEGVTLTAE